MMKPEHITEHYSAYLDHSLPDDLRRQVEAHLRDCPKCSAELTAIQQLVTDLHCMPHPALPANFTAGVRARLPQRRQQRMPGWLLPVFAVSTLTVTVALLLLLATPLSTPLTMGKSKSSIDLRGSMPAKANSVGMKRDNKLISKVENNTGAKVYERHQAQATTQPVAKGKISLNSKSIDNYQVQLRTDSMYDRSAVMSRPHAGLPNKPAMAPALRIALAPPALEEKRNNVQSTMDSTLRSEKAIAPEVTAKDKTYDEIHSVQSAKPENTQNSRLPVTTGAAEPDSNGETSGVGQFYSNQPHGNPKIETTTNKPLAAAATPPISAGIPSRGALGSAGASASEDARTRVDTGGRLSLATPQSSNSLTFSSRNSSVFANITPSTMAQPNLTIREAFLSSSDTTDDYQARSNNKGHSTLLNIRGRKMTTSDNESPTTRRQLSLRMSALENTQLSLTYVAPPNAGVKQDFSLPARNSELMIDLPQLDNGGIAKLAFTNPLQSTAYLLFMPRNGAQRARLPLHFSNEVALQVWQKLANASGCYLLCLSSDAERTINYSAHRVSPITALNTIATQQHLTVQQTGSLLLLK